MKRRLFLRNSLYGLSALPLLGAGPRESAKKKIRFGVCTDTHQDIFPGVEERLGEFIEEAGRRKVDFIIQMGDFCFPRHENKNFMSVWNGFSGVKYHVLGNHDMDRCTKEEALDFFGADTSKHYYSFDARGFHFVVLDPNNILENGDYIPYHNGNYFSAPGRINYITPEQLEWLARDLAENSKPVIVFSHQPLNQTVTNKSEVLRILRDAGRGKVLACFSGHLHKNWHVTEDNIHHVQINSMSYFWAGDRYSCSMRYPEDIHKAYPYLRNMIPYRDSLYAFVEIDTGAGEIRITGKSSEFIPPGPVELGITDTGIFAPSPSIDSRVLRVWG